MDAFSRQFPSQTRPVPSDDLDLQPVREVRPCVLNEIPNDPSVPSSPRIQLNFVDVSFPKDPSKQSSRAGSIDKVKSHKRNHRNASSTTHLASAFQEETNPLNKENKRTKILHQAQATLADDGRRQFVSQLLKKGVPVWEKIPQDELDARNFGLTDHSKHQMHLATNITMRNAQRSQGNHIVPSAVWEDVRESPVSFNNLPQGERPWESQVFSNERNSKREVSAGPPSSTLSNSPVSAASSKSSYSHSHSHRRGGENREGSSDRVLHTCTLQNSHQGRVPVDNRPCSNSSQEPTLPSSLDQPADTELRDFQGEQSRPQRIMKKKFGGRLDDNNIIDVRTWRKGEQAVREMLGPSSQPDSPKKESPDKANGEEEKHEKEPTKEVPKKRNLSAHSHVSDQPSKRQQRLSDKEEKREKTPPRSRCYKVEEVRKFMEKRRRERSKSHRERKHQEEMNQVEKGDRLKKLAEKTKELALVNKNPGRSDVENLVFQGSQVDLKPSAAPNWGCPDDCQHDIAASDPNKAVNTERDSSNHAHLKSPPHKHSHGLQDGNSRKESDKELVKHRFVKERKRNRAQEHQKNKNGKKKTLKSTGLGSISSESVSDLVSRTLEECEKQLRSSSLSLSSIPTSLSLESSENESQSILLSESSSVDIPPNQRVVALGQMAQKLTSRIAEEEENLRHCVVASTKNEDHLSRGSRPSLEKREGLHSTGFHSTDNITVMRGSKEDNAQESFEDLSHRRDHVSFSEIQMLSVEELKARMTAMLLPSTSKALQSMSNISLGTGNKELQGKDSDVGQIPKSMSQDGGNARIHSPTREDIPSLMIPDTPRLYLHGAGKIVVSTDLPKEKSRVILPYYEDLCQHKQISELADTPQERLLDLPGNNVHLPTHHLTNPHKSKNSPSLSQSTRIQSSQRKKLERAALCIQAAYRGYRVRKVTNYLLRKHFNEVKNSNSKASHGIQAHAISPKSYQLSQEFSMRSSVNDVDVVNKGIDWVKIREELDSEVHVSREAPSYNIQRKDLPEWIRPYMLLSESGNISKFVEASAKATNDSVIAGKKDNSSLQKSFRCHNVSKRYSGKENNDVLSNSIMNDTLTEGPIFSDVEEKSAVVVFEKETQTPLKPRKQKRIIEDVNNEVSVRNRNLAEFVDMKSQHKKSFLFDDINLEDKSNLHEVTDELSSSLLSEVGDGNNKKKVNENSVMNDTLEEGSIADTEGESKDNATSKRVLSYSLEGGVGEAGKMDSSEVYGISEISKSSSQDPIAPHQLLGNGPHFGPANLRLRLNAELMYQDTVNDALNQLQGVEQLHILSKNKEKEFAFAHSWSAAQQQEHEAFQKAQEEKERKATELEKKEARQYRKRELKIHQEALSTVERIEREAKERLDQLERDVRARAEQIMVASQRAVEHNSSQPEVIATAAVAAVDATLSHWERMKHMQGNHSSRTESTVSHSKKQTSSSYTHTRSYSQVSSRSKSSSSRTKSSSGDHVSESVGSYISVSERITRPIQDTRKTSSVTEEVATVNPSSLASSVVESVHSEGEESTVSSVSEVVKTTRSYTTSHTASEVQEVGNLTSVVTSGNLSNSESIPTFFSKDKTRGTTSEDRLSRSREKSPSLQFVSSRKSSSNISEVTGLDSDKNSSKPSGESIMSEIHESSLKGSDSASAPLSEIKESFGASQPSVSKGESSVLEENTGKESGSILKSIENSEVISSIPESIGTSKTSRSVSGSIESSKTSFGYRSSKKSATDSKNEGSDLGGNYAESFEVESVTDGSLKASGSSQKPENSGGQGDMSLVVSSNLLGVVDQMKYKDSSHFGKSLVTGGGIVEGGHTALGMTLNLVESLQKEEEVRLQHQTALLKLQEQSLIEEARWKLAALQSEGGPGLRRRERAVLLQLREQRSYLRRLIETQNLAAQQRRLLLLQHHHLLATTFSINGASNKGYSSNSRGHSPNPSSPRLTPRMMEISISSSSEGQDDISLHLSVKSKDTASSSLSDNSSHDRHRSRSAERKRISSTRFQDKRRVIEADTLQKAKSSYESPEKDLQKAKRKIDMVSKRNRDKKEKSPVVSARMSENIVLTESSVLEESIEASTHESSVTEEGGSESVSHSDIASSVSEQEGTILKSKPKISMPSELSEKEKSSSVEEVLTGPRSSMETSSSRKPTHTHKSNSKTISNLESSIKSLGTQNSESTIRTVTSDGKSQETGKSSTIQSLSKSPLHSSQSKSVASSMHTSQSKSVISEDIESASKSSEIQSNVRTSVSTSEKQLDTREGSSGSEGNNTTQGTSASSKSISQIIDSKASSSKGTESKSSQRSSTRGLPLPLRVPLSPRSLHRQRRRYSSESDDSFTLSQTETASDVSDGEGKLIALKEQLAFRRAEADKLRREKRRLRRERLASQEQALRQQIANYDSYIQQAKLELEKESKELQQASQVRPLIKKPQVAESKKLKHSESLLTSPEKSDVSDLSVLSECSKSDQSLSAKSQEGKSEHSFSVKPKMLKSDHSLPPRAQELESKVKAPEMKTSSDSIKAPQTKDGVVEKVGDVELDHSIAESRESHEDTLVEDVLSKGSSSSISEEYSFEEDSASTSDHSVINRATSSLSRDSSQDTDHSPSQASSTETIVHSPKKLDSGKNDEEGKSFMEGKTDDDVKSVGNVENISEDAPILNNEVEKKLDIYIPTSHAKSEGEESSCQDKDTSVEESIDEEIADVSQSGTSKDDLNRDSSERDISSVEKSFEGDIAGVAGKEDDCSFLRSDYDSENSAMKGLIQDNQHHQDLLPDEPMEDEKIEELVHQRTSIMKERQVDDISNGILATLMKETTLLFANIVKEKEFKTSEGSFAQKGMSEFTASVNAPMSAEKEVSGEIPVDVDASNDCSGISSKSQVKRASDLTGAGNTSSPFSDSLNSPRLCQPQPLTFDISPNNLSPTSIPTSPTKPRELDSGKPSEAPSARTAGEAEGDDDNEGASPSHDLAKAKEYSLDTDALTSRLMNLSSTSDIDLDAEFDLIEGDTEFAVAGMKGTWYDDSFWTASDSRKKQQQLKAEEERIAAEIADLEELQRLEEQYPGLVIREVPNKPPPPYTPPGLSPPASSTPTNLSPSSPTIPPAYSPASPPPDNQLSPLLHPSSGTLSMPHRLSKADLRKLATEIFHVVPSSQDEVMPIVAESLDCVYRALESGADPNTVEPPSKFSCLSPNGSSSDDTSEEEEENCARIFNLLIFSLTREIIGETYNLQRMPTPPPWMRQSLPPSRMMIVAHAKSKETLGTHASEKIRVIFGWKALAEKESLLLRWARKHRDLVDQVLVKELQVEESSWTCYDEDEASVKFRVANEILDCLLDETITLFINILTKKITHLR